MLLRRAVEAFVRAIVAEAGGVCDRSVVVDRLCADLGADAAEADDLEELVDVVVDECPGVLASFADGRVADVARVAERMVLTHRLSAAEVATATLDLSPDLAVFSLLAKVDGGLHADDGSLLRLRERRRRGCGRAGATCLTTHLEGPARWLQAFRPGELLAVRAAGGFLDVAPVDEDDLADSPADLAEGLRRLLEDANEGDGFPIGAEELQVAAAVDHREWFSVERPPFGQLVEAAGFELDGQFVGPPGCWEQHRLLGDLVATIARHDVSEAETSLLLDVLKAFDAWRSDRGARSHVVLAERLHAEWRVAYAMLEELRRKGAGGDDLAGFAGALGGAVGQWLASRAAALRGDSEDAERLAAAAAAAAPGFGPGLAEAAWYASDRGRARDAVNLLHRVRRHDDPELGRLRRLAAASAPAVGRNERCPCGSGRKYKACHLGRSALPESERVHWLLHKVSQYVTELAPPELLDDAAAGNEQNAAVLAMDLLVFDDGWLERFVVDRGPLLPDVERRWADRWSHGHIGSVFRLWERHGDGRLEMEDTRSGMRYTVEPSPAMDDVAPGRLVWARLVPVQDKWWTTGFVRHTGLAERSALLEATTPGTPITRRLEALAPHDERQGLHNTSGHPAVLCTTVVAVESPAAVAERLDASFERDGDEPAWHTSADTTAMERAVTARFCLGDGGRLTIETNSIERRDAALRVVAGVLGASDVIEEARVPIARAQALHLAEGLIEALSGLLGGVGDDEVDDSDGVDDGALDDPEEIAAVLAEIMKVHEERWLDQPVPVLGGRTPRQAASDDASRADLITLLAEMGDRDGGFDAERLRSRLGVS